MAIDNISPTEPSKGKVGKKILAGLGVISTVVAIGAGIHEMTKDDPPPTTHTTNNTSVNMPGETSNPVYASVLPPSGFSTVYSWSYPTLNSTRMSEVPGGTQVELVCSAQGDTIMGDFTTTSLWYDTNFGYMPDAYLNTGTNQAQRPACR